MSATALDSPTDQPPGGGSSGVRSPDSPSNGADKSILPYQQGGKAAWLLFAFVVLGQFMAILDIQIVSSSIRNIQAGISASSDEVIWVQTAYLVAEVVMVPLSGYLARMMSTRILYMISITGFTLASVACACAWDIQSMIVFRVLQGFLGGAMIPLAAGSLYYLFPPKQQSGAIVLIGLVSTMGPVLGPTLGGYLTETASWHWLFLINVPPGIVTLAVVWRKLRIDRPDWTLLPSMDVIGLSLMAVFLGSLEYLLEEGPRNNWFQDTSIVFWATGCAAAGMLFFARVLTTANPIVDLRVLRHRSFAVGCVLAFVIGVCLYGVVYVQPLFFGQIRHYNSLQIGVVMSVMGVAMFVSAPLGGKLMDVFDPRYLMSFGLGMVALSNWISTDLTADSSIGNFCVAQTVRGVGLVFCFIPSQKLALGGLSQDELKTGSGVFNLMRNLGGAIGLAVLNSLVVSRTAYHWNQLIPAITDTRPVVQEALRHGTGDLAQRITTQAQVLMFSDLFLVMAVCAALGLLLMPLVEKPVHEVQGGH